MNSLSKALLLLASAMLLPMTANASLVLTLSDDGSNGTVATFVGTGTTSDYISSSIDVGSNIGEFAASNVLNNFRIFLDTPLAFAGTYIIELHFDWDYGLDDFDFHASSSTPGGTDYDINASSLVTGLAYSDLIPGTYFGNDVDADPLGGFRLEIGGFGTVGDVSYVPIPAALPLFLSAVGVLGFMGWRKQDA